MVEEAILNVRNFLIITNAVLNPDGHNLRLVLPPVLQILLILLEDSSNVQLLVDTLLYALRDDTFRLWCHLLVGVNLSQKSWFADRRWVWRSYWWRSWFGDGSLD